MSQRAYKLGGKCRKRLRRALIRRDGEQCYRCGDTDHPLTIEHVLPIARGGSNRLENLRLFCEPCNWAKGDSPWSGVWAVAA